MTSYNEKSYIKQSIQSVVNQSYNKWNLIIVDDGSIDGTKSIAKQFSKKRNDITLIEADHGGRAKALNTGLNEASGDVVAIQDADDIAEKNRIAKQVHFLKENNNVAIVGGKCRFVKNGKTLYEWKPPRERWIGLYRLIGMPIAHTTMMFRKEVLKDVGMYRDEAYIDYDFVARASNHFTIHNLDDILVTVNVHDDSVMGSEDLYDKISKVARSRYRINKIVLGNLFPIVGVPIVAVATFMAAVKHIMSE